MNELDKGLVYLLGYEFTRWLLDICLVLSIFIIIYSTFTISTRLNTKVFLLFFSSIKTPSFIFFFSFSHISHTRIWIIIHKRVGKILLLFFKVNNKVSSVHHKFLLPELNLFLLPELNLVNMATTMKRLW